jgi:phage terminase small subunit
MPQRITSVELTGLKPQHANFVIEYVKDFSPRRAAEASGYGPEYGSALLMKDHIKAAINHILSQRLETTHIDAEWVLMEAVDNHLIARQQGNISASNTSLNMVMKHTFVDALAAEKVEVNSDKEVMERLQRGRKRLNVESEDKPADEVSFL